MNAHTATPRVVRFWVSGAQEMTRSTLPCPTLRCKNVDCHPVEVRYQSGTNEPAVIWDCGRHRFFSCRVQDWCPVRAMRLA